MIVVERNGHVFLGSRAELVVPGGRDMAWAERYVRTDKHLGYIIGNFVEANRPNQNGQTFTLEDLKDRAASLTYKPLNWLHHEREIVGNYIGSEIVHPTLDGAAEADTVRRNPVLESAAAFYKFLFPEHFKIVERAHNEGQLYTSMECIGDTVTCNAPDCGKTYPYDGPMSPTYCADMQKPRALRTINGPHFGGGGIIVPPVRPGWAGAAVADLSELERWIETNLTEVEAAHEQVADEFPHLEPAQWEAMMASIAGATAGVHEPSGFDDYPLEYETARQFTKEKRAALAKTGKAMEGGGYPIATVGDLKNAIRAIGRAKDPAATKAHIRRRAKALNAENLIPKDW